MRRLAQFFIILSMCTGLGLPAHAQGLSHERQSSAGGREQGMDLLRHDSLDRMNFDATMELLRRKSEDERERRELEERKRRLREAVITNTPEQLFDSYRRSVRPPYNTR
jgi:hypothetical protein